MMPLAKIKPRCQLPPRLAVAARADNGRSRRPAVCAAVRRAKLSFIASRRTIHLSAWARPVGPTAASFRHPRGGRMASKCRSDARTGALPQTRRGGSPTKRPLLAELRAEFGRRHRRFGGSERLTTRNPCYREVAIRRQIQTVVLHRGCGEQQPLAHRHPQ